MNYTESAEGMMGVGRWSKATVGGIVAILIWSSCVSVARLLSESLGVFTSASAVFLIAGVMALVVRGRERGALRAMLALPRQYLVWCGLLFVICQVGLYGGLGVAVDRLQVLEVGAINYLWPAFTLVFGVPILKLKSHRGLLALGTFTACAGVFAVTMDPQSLSLSSITARLTAMPAAYVLALVGALSWSVYSSLARKLAGGNHDAVPLFLFASGLALLGIRFFVHEVSAISGATLGALAYAGLLIAWGAYALWDIGVRRGDFALLSALSYAIPVLSTLLSCLILGVRPSYILWVGVAMVTAGAVLCRFAVRSAHEENDSK